MTMFTTILLSLLGITMCTKICDISGPLTNDLLQSMPENCTSIKGHVNIFGAINSELLERKFLEVSEILGCIIIKGTKLNSLTFMKNVVLIDCSSIQDNTTLNVIEMSQNKQIRSLNWTSLTTIIGPGIIDLGGLQELCLSNHEAEILLLHPQYHGNEWWYRASNGDICPNEGCMLNYSINTEQRQLDSDAPKNGCVVMGHVNIMCLACTEGPLTEPMKSVRIIIGNVLIQETFLRNLGEIFPNVELIYSDYSNSKYAITLRGNPYMSNISLPKLRRIKSPEEKSIKIVGSPLLKNVDVFGNVTNIFYPRTYYGPKDEYEKGDFVQLITGTQPDDKVFFYQWLIFGLYYPPIVVSILFNLRASILFYFGNAYKSIHGLKWFYLTFSVIHLLIATDSLILQHTLSLGYFSATPHLPTTILYNEAFTVFCKTVFIAKELGLYIPITTIIYVFLEIAGLVITKFGRLRHFRPIVRVMYAIILLVLAFWKVSPMFANLTINARSTSDNQFWNYGARISYKYAIVASLYGSDTRESWCKTTFSGCGSRENIHFENAIYADGMELTETQLDMEWISCALFGLYILMKFLDFKNVLQALPYDLSLLVILMQYSVLRYASLRNYLIRDFWNYDIQCIGSVRCAQKYTHPYNLAIMTHHAVYQIMCLCSILNWYTARYFHYLGRTIEVEKVKEESKKSLQNEQDIGSSFMKK